jgi:phosphate:Na+ symporter
MEAQYREEHMERLFDECEQSIETHAIHMELMDLMKQINIYAANIAKTIPVAGW